MQTGGKVYLVGAGPGDPGLITWRGLECLRSANIVLYDYLANPRILEACPHAEHVCLGRHGHDRIWSQDQINARLIAEARGGKSVVRLKAGDPAVFARFAEETGALEAAGISYEVIPGITAALAVASYSGIPLTHRDLSSAVALVAGQQKEDEVPAAPLDYRALAAFPGTLVFYMGVTSAPQWTAELMAGGKPPATPAAIVRRCSWPDQTTTHCRLDEVAQVLAARHMRPPVLVIVGDVVSRAESGTWFTRRPLFGQRVLVTRPVEQASSLRQELAQLGAEVHVQPAIEIAPPDDWGSVDDALTRLNQFDWLVFSSANGVRAVLERILQTGGDVRRLGGLKLAAIGPGTAAELELYRLKADLVPDEFRAESLAKGLAGQGGGRRFLLARASRGREVLAETLRAAGAELEQIVVYQSRDVRKPDAEIQAALAAGHIDWITVTSSAIARSLAGLFGDDLKRAKLVSISPVTSATLAELGLVPAAEAAEYTMLGLVQALLAAAAKQHA
jgi:uroporphyrinogen III methyltransferase/synthase